MHCHPSVRSGVIGCGSELILRTGGSAVLRCNADKADPLDRNPIYRMFRALLNAVE
jgi:hypothetical protein